VFIYTDSYITHNKGILSAAGPAWNEDTAELLLLNLEYSKTYTRSTAMGIPTY